MAAHQRIRAENQTLDTHMGDMLEQPPILEGARLSLVCIHADVMRFTVVQLDDAPLPTGGERGATMAKDA